MGKTLSFRDLTKFWWAIFWRNFLVIVPILITFTYIVSKSRETIDEMTCIIYALITIILSFFWSVYSTKLALNKEHFGTFKIKVYDEFNDRKDASFGDALSFWWAYTWRTLGAFIFFVVVEQSIIYATDLFSMLPIVISATLIFSLFRLYITISFFKFPINKRYKEFKVIASNL